MIAPIAGNNGAGGPLFEDPKQIRRDARMAAWIISLGVVPEEKARQILAKALQLAEDAADAKKSRAFCSLMKTVADVARLELNAKQLEAARPVREESSIDAEYSRDDLLAKLEKRASELPPSN